MLEPDLSGQVALVTGSAKGVGRDLLLTLAECGADVAVHYRSSGEAAAEVARKASDLGVQTTALQADVTDPADVAALFDGVETDLGTVDILVNNAGVVQGGKYDDISDEEDELTLDVNVEAVHWMTKKFLHLLEDSDDSHIVQMASAAGMIGVPDQVVYSASKWFVIGFSRALRQELQSYDQDHVNMTIVSPSLVDTGMFEGSDPPMLMPTLDPDYMADQIVNGVKNNKLFVREPFLVKLMPFMKGVLPVNAVDFVLEKMGARDLMKNWTGRH